MAFDQDPAEAVDRPQRRAQVVRDAVGERLQLLVGLAKLARAQRHARFQRAVERVHARLRAQALGDVLDLHQAGDVLADIARHR
ncbi:hypothetical protein HIV01_004295 [Lysobacter arenosi]|uniref:Uncharacterized protein n=1 Tax=Lysobacter arenosi TaxID=2795387 RepID=A0ABX7RE87_9GAMM|nr:hypothetical protein [Lysobacter arenosi]QSX75751.1 hypothetical protein HIV01_004295 [Lysobacter arenosi]